MKIGEWYVQRFSDQHLYFQALAPQKNGGMAGVAYTVDLTRPRAKAKPKKSSVSAHEVRHLGQALWRWISVADIPFDRFRRSP
jgi:hypothetical protein